MSKVFMMRMTLDIAVVADDVEHASQLANYTLFMEALNDTGAFGTDIKCVEEITNVEQLDEYGWDGGCIPYGDGDDYLRNILKNKGE